MSNTAEWKQVEDRQEWTRGEGIYRWTVQIKDGAPPRWILLDHRSRNRAEYPGPYNDHVEQIRKWADETITEICSIPPALQEFFKPTP